jgi:hypothetical protein
LTQPSPPPKDIASASTNSVIAVRLRHRLRAELETNRRLRFARLRQRMRKSALSKALWRPSLRQRGLASCSGVGGALGRETVDRCQ